MSLQALRAMRLRGFRPQCVRVIVGRQPKWWGADEPGAIFIAPTARTIGMDLRPLVGLDVHVIQTEGDGRVMADMLNAVEQAGGKVVGFAAADGVVGGQSPEHEYAIRKVQEGLWPK